MAANLAQWLPRLRLFVLGAVVGLIPSLVAALAGRLYDRPATVSVANVVQLLAWLCYCGTVLGAMLCLGTPRRRWIGYGLLVVVVLTAIMGTYDPLPNPSI